MILSLFGLGDDDDERPTPPTSEEIADTLDDVEVLLNDLFTDPLDETSQAAVTEDDEEEMVMMM